METSHAQLYLLFKRFRAAGDNMKGITIPELRKYYAAQEHSLTNEQVEKVEEYSAAEQAVHTYLNDNFGEEIYPFAGYTTLKLIELFGITTTNVINKLSDTQLYIALVSIESDIHNHITRSPMFKAGLECLVYLTELFECLHASLALRNTITARGMDVYDPVKLLEAHIGVGNGVSPMIMASKVLHWLEKEQGRE